jgi:hypothetical protein
VVEFEIGKDANVSEAMIVAALTVLCQAKPGEDKILSQFVGSWEAEGKHLTESMKGNAQYDWVLGKQFLKGEVKIGTASFSYEATLYFRPTEKEGSYSVTWLDNMGNIISATMVAAGKTLTMEWMEKTPQGPHPAKSEITMQEKGWIDRSFIKQGDKWVELGATTFKKAGGK